MKTASFWDFIKDLFTFSNPMEITEVTFNNVVPDEYEDEEDEEGEEIAELEEDEEEPRPE